ncbi:MAG: methyltransferase [Desulfovibrio sp.]|jgi:tRNA1Val (adenine37-N6)-methyltransferase|nr:methyltransferase [Desulfovibrio sp.]
MNSISVEVARSFFPRGLFQPEGSFRFSLDALLLASFLTPANQGIGGRLLDIGTGCGVVALGMLCRYPALNACGLDLQPELVEATRINAARLGFADRFTAVCRDVASPEPLREDTGAFSLVLANPPYRQPRCGRLPVSRMRLTALFETEGSLLAFCRAAELAMTPDGRFGIVFPAARVEKLLSALTESGLTVIRLLPVHARIADPPMLVLAEAVKTPALQYRKACLMPPDARNPFPELQLPLSLHNCRGAIRTLTEQVLAFCPFLACNHRVGDGVTRQQVQAG